MDKQFQSPVLLIIFNRPDKVRAMMNALSEIKPRHLYISADGPRSIDGESEKCILTRRIAQEVAWPCVIETNFSDTNLGCRIGVSSAITWFFTHVEQGIILEDDCLPDPTFFKYAEDLLQKYKNSEEIMHISGTTLLYKNETRNPELSYHLSHIAHVWGWASWRRAWDKFDINMSELDSREFSNQIKKDFKKSKDAKFWLSLFKHVRDKKIDTWDAQWNYSILKSEGYSITPHTNMISNIGFGADATHTKESSSGLPSAQPMPFPVTHPGSLDADTLADEALMDKVYAPSFLRKALMRLKFIL